MFGLAFLSPLFLAGVAAAVVPVAIHMFSRRAEPVIEFAAMRYLRAAPVEQARRRRLRELLLLALRVAALVLLACAFARPYVSATASGAATEATMVLVDVSASLTAPGQFEQARARAEQIVREAPSHHLVGVMSFGAATQVVVPVGANRAGALAALSQLAPGAGAARLQSALQRAGEELGGRSGRIVVITDLQQSGWDRAAEAGVPAGVAVIVEEIDGPAGNTALGALRVEEGEAVALVRNVSAAAVEEQVVFEVDGRRIGAVPVSVAPHGTAEARLALPLYAQGALRASVGDRQGYAADNERFAVLGQTASTAVLVVTARRDGADALYVRRALGAAEGAAGFRVQQVDGRDLAALAADAVGDVDVVVLAAARGLDGRGRERLAEFVQSGGGVLVLPGPDADASVLRQTLGGILRSSVGEQRAAGSMSLLPDDVRHPIFRPFSSAGTFAGVSFSRVAHLEPAPEASVLARFTDGSPAVVEERARTLGPAAGRVLVFASDLNNRWNDFPLQPMFVPFLHEAVRYLAASRPVRPDYLVGEIPGGEEPGVIELPAGSRREKTRRVAVNVDPRESDPRRMSADMFRSGVTRLQADGARQAEQSAREQEERQGLWRFALLLMMVALVGEGFLGRGSGSGS